MFKKRESSWRVLRLVTRLAFLPGCLVLVIAAFSLLSYFSVFSGRGLSYYSNPIVSPNDAQQASIGRRIPVTNSGYTPPQTNQSGQGAGLAASQQNEEQAAVHDPTPASAKQKPAYPEQPPKQEKSAEPPKQDQPAQPPAQPPKQEQPSQPLKAQLSVPPKPADNLNSNAAANPAEKPVEKPADNAAVKPAAKPEPASQPAAPATAKTCKWGKYSKWPYTEEFPLLSPMRHKLLYVKTPKSSSSTVAHILQRYTTREHMVVGYPDFKKRVYTLLDESFGQRAKELAGLGPKGHLDAIVSHMVYNATWVNDVLGTERPFRVTSIREPVARSWSMFLHGKEWNLKSFSFGARDPWEFARKVELNSQTGYIAGFGNGLLVDNPHGISKHYDHIVVSSRVVESIATLAPKLGMVASDLLFFSQKTDFHKKPLDTVTAAQKADIDAQLRTRVPTDTRLFQIAIDRLEKELARLPEKVRAIVKDVPLMTKDVKQVCGDVSSEDNSCIKKGEVVWDGNAVCLARCIARWADKHINCL